MMSSINFLNIICLVIVSSISSQKVEQISVQAGQSLSLDCKADELVYFGPQLNDWSEVKDGDNYLNLKFNYLTKDNILRITSDSAESTNTGFYACRKPVWTTTSMSRIYQVTVADVDTFYWTYVCHGAPGSCLRSGEESTDSSTSNKFEVADETNVDLFCCATVIGYKNVNINMNQIGDIRGKVYTKRKQDVDGSLVICANQHTFLSRMSTKNSRVLTCELVVDREVYSTITTDIIMKNAMPSDPDVDPPYGYTPSPKDDSDDNQRLPYSRAKSRIGKKLVIIIGSIIGSILLLALILLVIFILYRRKKGSTSSQTKNSDYIAVRKHDKNVPEKDPEYAYIDPVPLYQNTPIFTRH